MNLQQSSSLSQALLGGKSSSLASPGPERRAEGEAVVKIIMAAKVKMKLNAALINT